MGTLLEQFKVELDLANKTLGDQYRAMDDVKKKALDYNSAIAKIHLEMKSGARTIRDGTAAIKAETAAQKVETTEAVKRLKVIKELQKEQEKLNKIIERDADKLKYYGAMAGKLSSGIKTLGNTLNSASMSFAGFAGAAGFTGFGLKALTKVALDYNKTMFDLSRIQSTVGKGFGDVNSALAYVRKNTQMSEMQFLKLANSMMSSFVGIKPTMTDLAKLIGTIGEQFGYDYDKAKEFADLQGTFPRLFKMVEAGLEGIRNKQSDVVASARTMSLAFNQATGGGQKGIDLLSMALTEQTEAQKKYSSLLRSRAAAEKELSDAQLKVAKDLQPMIQQGLEMATKAIQFMKGYQASIEIVAVAMGVLGVAANAASVAVALLGNEAVKSWAKASGPLLPIIIAVTLLGLAAKKAFDMWGAAEEKEMNKLAALDKEMSKTRKATKYKVLIQTDVDKLRTTKDKSGTSQLERYKKAMEAAEQEAVKTTGKGLDIEGQLKAHADAIGQIKKDATGVWAEWERINKETKTQLEMLGTIADGYSGMASALQEAGGNAESLLNSLKEAQKAQLGEIGERLKAALLTADETIEALKEKGVDIPITLDITGDATKMIGEQVEALQKILPLMNAENSTLEQKRTIQTAIKTLVDEEGKAYKKVSDISKTSFAAMEAKMSQMEQSTSKFEARLNTERQLMEAAQFGLGASVAMMQKQVDLAYKMQETYAEADKKIANELKQQYSLNDAQMQAIQNATTQGEAEQYINNVLGARGQEQQDLLRYATKHQEITDKQMQQQLKIYELTKNIREGYLDAIREMAVGAGRFEKIIGTQTMGTTQLMKAVKGASGMYKLNTMALGGRQSNAQTAGGVGTNVAGGYGVGGLYTEGTAMTSAKNARIWNYGQSVDEARNRMKGGAGKKDTVGTANVPGATQGYMAPEREAQIKGNIEGTIIANKIVDLLETSRSRFNVDLNRGNAPGSEDLSKRNPYDLTNVGVRPLFGSNAPAPAVSPTRVSGVPNAAENIVAGIKANRGAAPAAPVAPAAAGSVAQASSA
ncbi:MAG TPA: hypothetical protein VMW01_07215, partial [Williamwhitmania sp.]|nr:hypothetical protein [Williamwhitmania sp.]